MIFAEIKPIVMTMTAVLLCNNAVTKVPVTIPFSGVLVSLVSHPFNLFPDKLNNPNLIMVMPKINNKINNINNSMYSMSSPPPLIVCLRVEDMPDLW